MSRYPSAYGHTPSYRSVASTVYPSALGRDPLDVPVFQIHKNKDGQKCSHSKCSNRVLVLDMSGVFGSTLFHIHFDLSKQLLLLRRASQLDLGPAPPSIGSLIAVLKKISLASTPTSLSAPALVPAPPCPTWSTTSSSRPSRQGPAPPSTPPATRRLRPRTRQRSTAQA